MSSPLTIMGDRSEQGRLLSDEVANLSGMVAEGLFGYIGGRTLALAAPKRYYDSHYHFVKERTMMYSSLSK